MDGWMHGLVGGWMGVWMDEWLDGLMDAQLDWKTNGRKSELMNDCNRSRILSITRFNSVRKSLISFKRLLIRLREKNLNTSAQRQKYFIFRVLSVRAQNVL
jgi:hypothetical protein